MQWHRFFPVLLVLLGLVLLTGALSGPSLKTSGQSGQDPLPAEPDLEATRTLDRALEALGEDRVSWLEAGIWQKVDLPGFVYQADGHYLMGPNHCFRLEVKTHMERAEGNLLMVSDGTTLWHATRVGSGPWGGVTRVRLQEVLTALGVQGGSAQLRTQFLEGPMFSGVAPLLHNLRTRLAWVRRKAEGPAPGRIRLTGVWPATVTTSLTMDQPWPSGLPRQCRLFLDAPTLWPGRVEWWGPATPSGPDALLAQLEFRDPVRNRPLPRERCTREFTFHPGNTPITDQTGAVTASLTARAQQLANP